MSTNTCIGCPCVVNHQLCAVKASRNIFQTFRVVPSESIMIKRMRLLFLLLFLAVSVVHAESYKLPGFGEGNTVSLDQEYYLGRAWLTSFRRQSPILDDPLVQSFVEHLVYRLAETSQLKERRLEIIVVDNESTNAFTTPGGIVGIHSGLLKAAETGAQFSSVLAHELAHLGRRHFIQETVSRRKSPEAGLAALLRKMVLVATSSPDATTGRGLRYSPQLEKDADGLGIYAQASAGLDPGGAAEMLEVMQGELADYGTFPPEYFLSHPVTQTRIVDARDQAARYSGRIHEASREYQLMRARVVFSFIANNEQAVAYFRERRAAGGRQAVPAQYGLILALTSGGSLAEARQLLVPMREFAPENITYRIAEAEIDIKANDFVGAIRLLEESLARAPANHPLTMALANAYIGAERYAEADKLLSRHSRSHPSDAHLWKLLADVQRKNENLLGMYQSQAEYFALNDELERAIANLDQALGVASNQITSERISTRIAYFESIKEALLVLR